MVLSEPRCSVAVAAQNAPDRRVVRADDRVVTRIPRRQLGDHAEARRVVVAAGDQRRARGRAKGRGIEMGVAQPSLCHAVQRRRRDHAAKRAAYAIALIVGHDEEHVGRSLGRDDPRRPPRLRVFGALLDHAAKLRRRWGELTAADRGRRAGLAQHARDYLRLGRCSGKCHGNESRRGLRDDADPFQFAVHAVRSLADARLGHFLCFTATGRRGSRRHSHHRKAERTCCR